MDTTDLTIKKMLLNATLKANLDTLQYFMPSIFDIFKNYTPTDSGVFIDDDGKIDLFNNGQSVYKGQAEEFSGNQVAEFIRNPLYYNLELSKIDDANCIYDHQRALNKISNRQVKNDNKTPFNEERYDFVCMVGSGLGYQITELFQNKKVQHFLLCEHSTDVFFAMLHCIELRPLIERCIANGGSFNVKIGNNDIDVINGINDILIKHGRFYLARFYFYQHYNSETNDASLRLLKTIGYRLAFGFGFMEDEIIGFRHTLANLKLGYKVCKKQTEFVNQDPKRQIFIVANGPSLDFSLEFLKQNQNDIIIVSCGTTLRALLKNNIKPDIHIEMERPVEMLPIMEEVEKQQEDSHLKLKDIQIIALNTVYSELLKKFKSPLLLKKVNDAGGKYIEQLDPLNVYVAPEHTNPTCPNAAMALITSLGFKEIYLLGTDFGYISNQHHHSKDSFYYDDDYRTSTPDQAGIDSIMTEDISRKGNFRDFVFSTEVFDSSRVGIEMLLAKNTDVNAYNCADGALIANAKPFKIEDIKLSSNSISKNEFLTDLLNTAFDNKAFTAKKLSKMADKTFKVLKVTLEQLMLIITTEVNSREELADLFARQHHLLVQLEAREGYQVNYWLIQGTFKYFQTYIMSHCFLYTDPVERKEFINYSLEIFREHVNFLFGELLKSINT
ncbi:6-hydroxymethylpterin diphosphokinase MptE-like protein [Colwellia echini]|uniref:motility associated factor glycosyltransferase family protein n=1 Tax=Colwellia echini TaxID=1982103 RepID=UPI0014785DEC|nr:6-hydroxymethylpterin diphosphokinase MptE-like protein [Colwellia echini]